MIEDAINYVDYRIEYLSNYIKELEKYKLNCDIDIQKGRIEIYKFIKGFLIYCKDNFKD